MKKTFVKAIMAGVAIGFGGVAYLSVDNHVVGAFLFTIGLFTIYTFGLDLYTGKVCYIPNKSPDFLVTVVTVFLGNVVGTIGMGTLIRQSKLIRLANVAIVAVENKLADGVASTFIMAILCGFLMCVAVLGFQTIKDPVGKHIALILPVMVFILSGYEHSIANLFYYTLADMWSFQAFYYIVVAALGNLIGGISLPLMIRLVDKEKLGC